MSGIIDAKGIQWEHCNVCNRYVRLSSLGALKNTEGKIIADICEKCSIQHEPKYLVTGWNWKKRK